ncbi:hypothetical protein DFQ29_004403 [Apophysomyces sp. BC1021]|nr:hypothetical protein DFQ29_004403 [Apophysomyces sp. BC1021]
MSSVAGNNTEILPASRLGDYFFVAGVHDDNILPTYEAAKRGPSATLDGLYYHQQEQAATNGQCVFSQSPPSVDRAEGRKRGLSLPKSLSEYPRDSLHGVLDHVQAVIDNFDKERDTVRDTVIAVHDHTYLAEKFKKVTLPNQRQSFDAGHPRSLQRSKTWRHMADSGTDKSRNSYANARRQISLPAIKQEPILNILDVKYTPTVLTRYPKQDYSSAEPFPSYVAMFCFPRDVSLHYGKDPPPERSHSFAMTDDSGETIHGSCVIFYEPLISKLEEPVNQAIQEWVKLNMSSSTVEYAQHLQGKILQEQQKMEEYKTELTSLMTVSTTTAVQEKREELEELIRTSHENMELYKELVHPVKMGMCDARQIWVPKCIGILGRLPWLDLYGDWLRIMLDSVVGVRGRKKHGSALNIESVVYNFIREVPLPPPGRFEIGLTINQRPLFFSRPPINQVPLLKNFSLFPLFRALSPHLILAVLETLLSEGKVLFLSQYPGMLSLACESFRYLLFPFYWQFVFIPVLPEKLLTCLQAPVPYIIGFQGGMDDLEDHIPEDACVVNLDCNTMHQCQPAMLIPDRQRRKLQTSMEQYASLHTRSRVPYGVPLTTQQTFPNGRLLLQCLRPKSQDPFVSPAQPRSSESSDLHSIRSHSQSVVSRPMSGFWSVNGSTRSSNDSSISLPVTIDALTPSMPQFPGFAKLATNPQGFASSTSLHIQAVSATQASGPRTQRLSMPTQSSAGPPSQETAVHNRHSEPPQPRQTPSITDDHAAHQGPEGKSKKRLSQLMSKPRAVFQEPVETPAFAATRFSVPSELGPVPSYHVQPQEVTRRVKYMEGHVMIEVLPHEFPALHAHRCLCGKQIIPEGHDEPLRSALYMRCQECQLVTHEECVDQILHPCLPACFDEKWIQESFLRMFASLFYNYRSGFVDSAEERHGPSLASFGERSPEKKGNLYFSKDRFLKHSDKDTRAYLSHLADSQMFNQFITDRLIKSSQNSEVLMFDEYIKLKLNRSKLKFVKENTPFLNDESYRVSQIIWATPPDETIGQLYTGNRFPIDLDIPN